MGAINSSTQFVLRASVVLTLCLLTYWSVAAASICSGCRDESIVSWGGYPPIIPASTTDCQLYSSGYMDCLMSTAGVDAFTYSTLTNANLIHVQTGGRDTGVCVFVSSTWENQCWRLVNVSKNLTLTNLGALVDTDHDEIVDKWDCYPSSSGSSTCPTGYYATGTGMALAPAGSYAAYGIKVLCPVGSYQPDTGQISCLSAVAGYYVGTTGVVAQTACAIGTYQPNTGASYCYSASVGYYVSTIASATQTVCAAGTYQSNTGQSSCLVSTPVENCSTYSKVADTCASCAVNYQLSGNQCVLIDADSDGITDALDNCPTVSNADQLDFDGDTQGDTCDSDDDNDGVLDINDAFPLDPTESLDTDSDGIGNNADWDDDGDGVPDSVDAAPLDGGDASEITLPLDANYKGGNFSSSRRAQ